MLLAGIGDKADISHFVRMFRYFFVICFKFFGGAASTARRLTSLIYEVEA